MKHFLLFALCLFTFLGNSQIKTPSASPSTTVKQDLGLGEVTIEYSRPSVKDRTIFAADGLVPFGKKWRLGANSPTKVTFSEDVSVNGTALKAGSYAVLATPTAAAWTFHFYEHGKGGWTSYLEKTEMMSVSAPVQQMPMSVETFTITTGDHRDNSAKLEFLWDKSLVALDLEVAVDETVMAEIAEVMAGPSNNDYYRAATYYHKNGKDMDKALTWINKATSGSDQKFWMVHRKALILGDMGKTKDAIAAAKTSMELAQKAEYQEYVTMNQKFIEKMSK